MMLCCGVEVAKQELIGSDAVTRASFTDRNRRRMVLKGERGVRPAASARKT
jgi:hypothetical protein